MSFRFFGPPAKASFTLSFSAFVSAGPRQEAGEHDERDDGDDGADLVPIADGTVKQDCGHKVLVPMRIKSVASSGNRNGEYAEPSCDGSEHDADDADDHAG